MAVLGSGKESFPVAAISLFFLIEIVPPVFTILYLLFSSANKQVRKEWDVLSSVSYLTNNFPDQLPLFVSWQVGQLSADEKSGMMGETLESYS